MNDSKHYEKSREERSYLFFFPTLDLNCPLDLVHPELTIEPEAQTTSPVLTHSTPQSLVGDISRRPSRSDESIFSMFKNVVCDVVEIIASRTTSAIEPQSADENSTECCDLKVNSNDRSILLEVALNVESPQLPTTITSNSHSTSTSNLPQPYSTPNNAVESIQSDVADSTGAPGAIQATVKDEGGEINDGLSAVGKFIGPKSWIRVHTDPVLLTKNPLSEIPIVSSRLLPPADSELSATAAFPPHPHANLKPFARPEGHHQRYMEPDEDELFNRLEYDMDQEGLHLPMTPLLTLLRRLFLAPKSKLCRWGCGECRRSFESGRAHECF